MNKTLEKSLKDARKESRLTLGSRQVMNAISDSKMIVASRSLDKSVLAEQISSKADACGIPIIRFGGTSVALGRACGLQFRVSAVAFSSLAETNVNAIIK